MQIFESNRMVQAMRVTAHRGCDPYDNNASQVRDYNLLHQIEIEEDLERTQEIND